MPKNEARKRDMISFLINGQVRKSAASCRFVEEYRASGEHAEKREKVVAALRSGQLLEEAGLQPVMAFLDTEGFESLDVKQRQQLVLARLQDFLGVSPQLAPAAVPVEPVQPPAAPPVAAPEPEQVQQPEPPAQPAAETPEEAAPPATDAQEPPAANKKAKTANSRLSSFADKLST